MIPLTVDIIEEDQLTISSPSRTYNLDYTTNRVAGMIDDDEALIQTIDKILNISRYEYVIYDWYYGHEILNLIGKPFEYVKVEIPRIIREALIQDDRIINVTNVSVSRMSIDSLFVACEVETIYGQLTVESEVTL